jgi:hypothetical protein
MRQVDLMVDARKQEWIKEKRTLQAKLEVREQELILQKATLSQKHTEVGICLLLASSRMLVDVFFRRILYMNLFGCSSFCSVYVYL